MSKPDFLQECLTDPALVSGPVPIDTFTREICLVCMNRACARAGTNNMAFDRRAANWRKDLFEQVPRAADDDPNFGNIRAKRFLPVAPKLEIPGTPTFVTVASTQAAPQPPPPPPAPPTHFVREEPARAVEQPAQPAPAPAPPAPQQSLQNTPFHQGTVLPGAAQPAKQDVVVKPGATFTFDDE